MDQNIYFLCDPEKNYACAKTSCKSNPDAICHDCEATSKVEFARLDESGQPIRYDLVHGGVVNGSVEYRDRWSWIKWLSLLVGILALIKSFV